MGFAVRDVYYFRCGIVLITELMANPFDYSSLAGKLSYLWAPRPCEVVDYCVRVKTEKFLTPASA